ncbi:MAG: radical SAM protein [Acidobacteriia bacterium]|nr:radical SAM protein [Terriglobia bacterium]
MGLFGTGELEKRAHAARVRLEDCDLCARCCHVNRRLSIAGAACHTGERAIVHSYGPHHGEEDPLRGRRGSGTIFFSWCSLRCTYCQNWEISQKGTGKEATPEEIASMMLELQSKGCHNINLVTPSHVVSPILAALLIAAECGLRVPLVYNTGGFDSMEALALLDGVVDIYMPDMKYGDPEVAFEYSRIKDYVEVNRAAVREMHRQVGDLVLDEGGIAVRGLLIRHLVLPGGLSGTEEVLSFIARAISTNTYINLMDQYHPCYRSGENPPLSSPLTAAEYMAAVKLCSRYGLWRLDHRM